MKYILSLILLSCITKVSYAQNDSLYIDVSNYGNIVQLRFHPSTVDVFEDGLKYGYNVTRHTTHANGQPLSQEDRYQSLLQTKSFAKPYPKHTLINKRNTGFFADSTSADLLIDLLYEDISLIDYPTSGAEIRSNQQTLELRYIGLTSLSDEDYQVARALNIGTNNWVPTVKNTYLYTVWIEDDNGNVLHERKVSLVPKDIRPSLDTVKVEAYNEVETIRLAWTNPNDEYSRYFVQRKESNQTWADAIESPYMFASGEAVANGQILYIDKSIVEGITYEYRIKGVTLFGQTGGWSQPVQATSLAPRKDYDIAVGLSSIDENFATLSVAYSDSIEAQDIASIDIYKATKHDGNYEPISNSSLSLTDSLYTLTHDGQTFYVIGVMADNAGHTYRSGPVLVQPDDTTPPAVPTNVVVTAQKEGQVLISWDKNETDADIYGYRVYRGFTETAEFFDITGFAQEKNSVEDYVDPYTLTDEVCYNVASVDIRGNTSDVSQTICVNRPDLLAPSAPLLFSLFPTANGIKISWELSKDSDVGYHRLERRRNDEDGWTTVISWDSKSDLNEVVYGTGFQQFNYIDKSNLLPITYVYRLIAGDEYENESSSDQKSVVPLHISVSPPIVDFQGSSDCSDEAIKEYLTIMNLLQQAQLSVDDPGSTTSPNTTLITLLGANAITLSQYTTYVNQPASSISSFISSQVQDIQQKITSKRCIIQLTWTTEIRPEDVDYLYVFKGFKTNSELPLYDVVQSSDVQYTTDGFAFYDPNTTYKLEYDYQVQVYHKDGSSSRISPRITVLAD